MEGVDEKDSFNEVEDSQPFNPYEEDNAAALQLIVSLRIYDVLLALLRVQAPATYKAVMEEHSKGNLIAFPPDFVRTFIASDINVSPEA